MNAVALVVLRIGQALLALGLIRLSIDAVRRRDHARVDVLFVFGLLLVPLLSPTWKLNFLAAQLVPIALLRLIRHFRPVPGHWIGWTSIVAAVTPAMALAIHGDAARISGRITSVYSAIAMIVLGTLLFREAQRSLGVKKTRIVLAAVGTLLIGLAFATVALIGWFSGFNVAGLSIGYFSSGIAFVCYYLAFAPPRILLTRWRRAEQARYLETVNERDPEERGDHAADDVFQAAVRGGGGAVTFVALEYAGSTRALEVVAASAPTLKARQIATTGGLVTRAMQTGAAEDGLPGDCEPDVARAIAPYAERVLVAPLRSSGRSWGVVVVAQRRGSLFPEDDLAMLAQVARNAGAAIDHARLIGERRARERAAADRRLRQVESRVELMLDSIKDYAMLVLDAVGRVTAWHPGAQHVFGHARHEVIDVSASGLYDMSPEQFGGWLDEARVWGSARREGRCRRRDGAEFVGTTVIRPLIEDAGGTPGFVVVTHDVTDRRNLEERLRQGQKMEAIGQLAGGVAHDFNNLLTAITGYADWLAMELAGDRRQEQVAEIQKAADRAAKLTQQLLAFSRRQAIQMAPVDLNELIADILPMLRRLVGDRIVVNDEPMSMMPAIMADRGQIERVVVNMAVNARDAMPDGGYLTIRTSDVWLDEGLCSVGATELVPGPHVILEVADTGVGMDAETRRRVFEPFFTTKEVGKGTGLGLSTAYGLVQQMGGAIEVESAPQRGARFRSYFPQASEPALAASRRVPPPNLGRGTETVLLVEDEDAVRRYLTHLLQSHGYEVLAAERASDALAVTQAFGGRIDLVISDMVIPGSTGPELMRLIGEARPGLSALFISGYADAAVARHAQTVASDRLLLKPFSSTELLTRIRRILTAA
jgi:two-component system cell cycle sensor histidine kinase/response regulator CckA